MYRDPWPILFFGATALPSSRMACIPPLGMAVKRAVKSKPYLERLALELAPVQGLAATCSESTMVVALLAAEPVWPLARAMLHRRPPTTRLSVRQPCFTLLS